MLAGFGVGSCEARDAGDDGQTLRAPIVLGSQALCVVSSTVDDAACVVALSVLMTLSMIAMGAICSGGAGGGGVGLCKPVLQALTNIGGQDGGGFEGKAIVLLALVELPAVHVLGFDSGGSSGGATDLCTMFELVVLTTLGTCFIGSGGAGGGGAGWGGNVVACVSSLATIVVRFNGSRVVGC